MDEHLSEVFLEAGLSEAEFEEVAQLLGEARTVPLPTMAPSAELAALWAAPPAVAPAAVAPRRSRRAAMVAIGIVCGLGAGTAAAAANVLPDPVQEVFADLSERLLPFDFPHPDRAPEPASPDLGVPEEPTVLAPSPPAGAETGHLDDATPGSPAPSPVSPSAPVAPPGSDGSTGVATPSPATSSGPSSSVPSGSTPAPAPTGPPQTSEPPVPVPAPPRDDKGPGQKGSQQAPQQAPQQEPALTDAVPEVGGGPARDGDEGGVPSLLGSVTAGLLTTAVALLPGPRA